MVGYGISWVESAYKFTFIQVCGAHHEGFILRFDDFRQSNEDLDIPGLTIKNTILRKFKIDILVIHKFEVLAFLCGYIEIFGLFDMPQSHNLLIYN